MSVLAIPKFIADVNVGRLGRWLRLLGFDTVSFKDGSDTALVNLALAENRVILTRDTRIQERRAITQHLVRLILIKSDRRLEQIVQVAHELALNAYIQPFTMCLECNEVLADIEKIVVETKVPPYVYASQNEFKACPKCGRIYWKGTHWQAMNQLVMNLD